MTTRRDFLTTAGAMAGGVSLLDLCAAHGVSPELLVHTRTPHNAEPPLDQLARNWHTPTNLFYVRSHAPVPEIDAQTFQLSIEGMVRRPFRITLAQLQGQFTRHSAMATLTCAGNRRSEHSRVKKVGGVPWQAGAIGNAQWAGVALGDLLRKAGALDGAKYVWFEGVDQIQRKGTVIPFGASIPMKTAMLRALVAYEMNGKPLTGDHGFPLRTVVPGFIGARSVKWLGKIVVSDRPSPNHYVANAYKLVTEGSKEEWQRQPPIDHYVVNSAICIPARGDKVKAGEIDVRGYALPPGIADRTIARVQLSVDGGRTWINASLESRAQPFCWQLWKGRVNVTADTSSILVRAIDSAGQRQPRVVAWNMKGYLFNAWYQTPVDVQP